eukprot:CAMPEP_0114158022 /NCGR_PEP_ID=MMETSP0043_2-20121206/26956_1 /TAXON_ID=464988 /ORGANISM="Hemiselmis andersenii, Strain CCMP644" /LENGTH=167 /DNA_ID=CAMNT_0001253675 /DNA_START=224 /DNA_END=724 /DNA_ORIENTATION=+
MTNEDGGQATVEDVLALVHNNEGSDGDAVRGGWLEGIGEQGEGEDDETHSGWGSGAADGADGIEEEEAAAEDEHEDEEFGRRESGMAFGDDDDHDHHHHRHHQEVPADPNAFPSEPGSQSPSGTYPLGRGSTEPQSASSPPSDLSGVDTSAVSSLPSIPGTPYTPAG